MSQDRFTEQISSWLDDELDQAEATALQNHLAHCSTCQQTYQQFTQIDQWLRQAAAEMVAPAPGFNRRVEARLATYRPRHLWQIWLAVAALVGGTILLLGVWAVTGGLALISVSTTVFNTSLLSQGLVSLIESTDSLRFFLEMGALLVRSSIITMQQPLFWGVVVVAAMLTLFWVWLFRELLQRGHATARLLLS